MQMPGQDPSCKHLCRIGAESNVPSICPLTMMTQGSGHARPYRDWFPSGLFSIAECEPINAACSAVKA